MKKKRKKRKVDYLKAIKMIDRAVEIAAHNKLISTRPQRIVKNKKRYVRKKDIPTDDCI